MKIRGTIAPIFMSHQSVFDLPLVAMPVDQGDPLVVTRERDSRGISVISLLVELYQYPTVNPTAHAGTLRSMIQTLRPTSRTTEVPLMMFPEGTRTQDGEIESLEVRDFMEGRLKCMREGASIA